ncbi:hypothetical protein NDU88_009425 [Pleurodeles waltl]|uniref:Secreted protein n=1 Tax=Pleurodeles waltl TaxID=8319 RepID=A0AAV7PS22_PLEWA|nr:hypothetical protein NDU88_009425 [Pleurodeles waltl]
MADWAPLVLVHGSAGLSEVVMANWALSLVLVLLLGRSEGVLLGCLTTAQNDSNKLKQGPRGRMRTTLGGLGPCSIVLCCCVAARLRCCSMASAEHISTSQHVNDSLRHITE